MNCSLDSDTKQESWIRTTTFVKCAAIVFITLAIVFGNLISILVRLTHRKLRKQVSSHFIQSLAVADLCVGLFHALPGLIMYSHSTECGPSKLWLNINVYFIMIASSVSLYSVVSISVDRYIAIMKPLRYRAIVTAKPCRLIIVSTWVWAAIIMSPIMTPWVITYYSRTTFTSTINHSLNKLYMVMLLGLVYLPTFFTLTLIYPRLMCVARKHVKRERVVRRTSSVRTARVRPESISRRTKYLRSTILVTAAYYITCVPRGVYFIYKAVAYPVPWLEFITFWLYISLSFLNCIIYSWGSLEFRKAALELWKEITRCIHHSRRSSYDHTEKKQSAPIFHIRLPEEEDEEEEESISSSEDNTLPFNKQVQKFNKELKVPGCTLDDALRRQSWSSWTSSIAIRKPVRYKKIHERAFFARL